MLEDFFQDFFLNNYMSWWYIIIILVYNSFTWRYLYIRGRCKAPPTRCACEQLWCLWSCPSCRLPSWRWVEAPVSLRLLGRTLSRLKIITIITTYNEGNDYRRGLVVAPFGVAGGGREFDSHWNQTKKIHFSVQCLI